MIKKIKRNTRTKTIENCRGAQCASALQRTIPKNTGITLIALIITILFSYDEKLKCSNSKGFLLQTI